MAGIRSIDDPFKPLKIASTEPNKPIKEAIFSLPDASQLPVAGGKGTASDRVTSQWMKKLEAQLETNQAIDTQTAVLSALVVAIIKGQGK